MARTIVKLIRKPSVISEWMSGLIGMEAIRDAEDVGFYYRGTRSVVILNVLDTQIFYITLPTCNLTDRQIIDKLRVIEDEGWDEGVLDGIEKATDFLFDLDTRRVVVSDSYMGYMPMKKEPMLFMAYPGTAYYARIEEVPMVMALVLAKKRLLVPFDAPNWSMLGSDLLHYLLARATGIPLECDGLPSYVLPGFKRDEKTQSEVFLESAVLPKTIPANPADTAKNTVVTPIVDEPLPTLSKLIGLGITRFIHKFSAPGDSSVIDVAVDVCADEFSEVMVDPNSGEVFVVVVEQRQDRFPEYYATLFGCDSVTIWKKGDIQDE